MKLIIVFLLIILQTSCVQIQDTDLTPVSAFPTIAEVTKRISDSKIYIVKELELSLYEPIDSCYIGAYVLSNKNINFDMNNYDNLTEKDHSIFIYNIRLGEPFPVWWILECIAQMKTPHIIIYEPNKYEPFDYTLLEQTAKDFGEFYTPLFVQFYPNPKKYTLNPDEYIDFYRTARNLFNEHASNAAFVWSVDSSYVYDSYAYYPGDDYVDWVGINIFEPIFENDEKYSRNFFNDLNHFYYTYQSKKPIMISQLAISHYSSKNHTYYNNEASKKLLHLYETIRKDYNRIKSINYMDVNNILLSPKDSVRDNFSITSDDLMLNTYKKVINDNYFLEDIQIMQNSDRNFELLKSAFDVYEDEENKYIPKRTLHYELDFFDLPIDKEIKINNQEYYKLTDLKNISNLDIIIDNNKILISNTH